MWAIIVVLVDPPMQSFNISVSLAFLKGTCCLFAKSKKVSFGLSEKHKNGRIIKYYT
jgi:hypothetical protein